MAQRDFKYGKLQIPTQQVPAALPVFENFFKQEHFDWVMEIGTSYGGLSLFLHEQSLIHGFQFVTFDISADRIKRAWEDNPIPFQFRVEDCFVEKTKSFIEEKLQSSKCLLLCDGGNKILEFNTFCEFLSKDSYIMAHDYSPNKTFYKQNISNQVWNWLEIQDEDVQVAMDRFDIKKSEYYNAFTDVVWLSCKKV